MNRILDIWFGFVQKLVMLWVKIERKEHNVTNITIDENQPVIYVLENRSYTDMLVADAFCQQEGLTAPCQRLSFGTLKGERSVISLKNRPSRMRQNKKSITPKISQMLDYLAEHDDKDIQLVPVSIIWGRGPTKSTSLLKAALSDSWSVTGRLQKLFVLIFNGRNTYLKISEPISLRQQIDEKDHNPINARKVSRVLRLHFRRVRTSIIGPDLSHRRLIVNQLLKSSNVKLAIEQYGQSKKLSHDQATKAARKICNEITANVSYSTVKVLDVIFTWLWNKIYNGVQVNNAQPVRELAKNNEIVYVPCHRSHFDYLLLSYALHHQGLNIPHIAAGINLNLPVVGSIIRRGGAFFMRRTFRGDKLYTAIFKEYMHHMFTHGHSMEYFIEGGRSRTGRSLTPRAGMIAMTVSSFLRDNNKPIVFVPVYIGYEKIMEAKTYVGELRGKTKKKENLFDLIKSVKRLKNYGKVSMNFGHAIHLQEELDLLQPNWQNHKSDEKPQWMNQVVDHLANKVMVRINEAAALNPVNLSGLTLLASEREAMDVELLKSQLELLVKMQKQNPYSDVISFPEGNSSDWVEYAEKLGTTRRIQHAMGDIIGLDSTNAVLMTYYRNNILHLYALPSLLACLFSQQLSIDKGKIIKSISRLYPYIQSELFLRWTNEEMSMRIESWIAFFENEGLIEKIDNQYRSAANDKIEHQQLHNLAQFMMPTLERFYLTTSVLMQQGSGICSTSELEAKSQQLAQRLSILSGLNTPEFFDKALFKNFISQLKQQKRISVNDDGKLEFDPNLMLLTGEANQIMRPDVQLNIEQVVQANQ